VKEVGEYESTSASGDFTQANADSVSFPQSNRYVTASYAYDLPSTEVLAAGQRNLKGHVTCDTSFRAGVAELFRYYSYDELGNTEWVLQKNAAGKWWQLKYEHDLQGRITKRHFLDGTSSRNNLYTSYSYDQMGRLTNVSTDTLSSGGTKIQEGAYTYYAGTTKRLQLASAQGVDYRYNSRDWLKQINQPDPSLGSDPGGDGSNGIPADVFATTLGYNTLVGIGSSQSATPHWNGNVAWTMYNMKGDSTGGSTLVGYTYGYDRANRITGANFGYKSGANWQATTAYDESGYSYDGNGNILGLQRYGYNGNLMDNLTYTYTAGKNRLRQVGDAVASGLFSSDIDNQQTDNYTYDDNGNLQQDVQRDIAFVVSDIHNLPISEWKLSSGAEQRYYYDAEGKRIRKDASITEYYVNSPAGNTEAVVKSDISAATHNIWASDNIGQVKRSGTTWSRYYYLKDHLGTIKMTVNTSGTVIGKDDYYPFGMQMDSRCSASSADPRYKFTGQERDAETGYDDFGARYYDARLGRFLSVDPHESGYPGVTPYCYAGNCPILFIDPTGMDSTVYVRESGQSRGGTSPSQVSTVANQVQSVLDLNGIPMKVVVVPPGGFITGIVGSDFDKNGVPQTLSVTTDHKTGQQLDATDVAVDLVNDSNTALNNVRQREAAAGEKGNIEGFTPQGEQAGLVTVDALKRDVTEIGLGNLVVHEAFHGMGLQHVDYPGATMSKPMGSPNSKRQILSSKEISHIKDEFLNPNK
jgi:RHS repeat-associated protein